MSAVLDTISTPSKHDGVSLVAGDDWAFTATFYDASGTTIDLTTSTISWALLDRNFGEPLLSIDFTVGAGTSAGQCTVTVPATSSTKVAPGGYMSYWRIVVGGVATTMLTGSVTVAADPFGSAVHPVQAQRSSLARVA